MQRAADRRRRRVDREDLAARCGAVEAVRAAGLPDGRPSLVEAVERRLFGDPGHGAIVGADPEIVAGTRPPHLRAGISQLPTISPYWCRLAPEGGPAFNRDPGDPQTPQRANRFAASLLAPRGLSLPRSRAAGRGWPRQRASTSIEAATSAGSTARAPLNRPIVGIAATPSGKGYWLVASTAASSPLATRLLRIHRRHGAQPADRRDGRVDPDGQGLLARRVRRRRLRFGDAPSTARPATST